MLRRCDGPPGQTTAQCGHECAHREIKRYMATIMGLGNALDHGCTVGKSIFILDAGATVSKYA
jgi:hypothetical protein